MAENPSSGWGTGSTGPTSNEPIDSTGSTGSTGAGFGTGTTGSSTGSGTGSPYGVTSATDRGTDSGTDSGTGIGTCPHCGQSLNRGGLEQFLGRLGITDDMIDNLKTQFQNVEIDEYLNTAREYLKNSGGKATTYAKENPGKVAAGVAALAFGAGLIYAATNRK
jgi:hypothetical protein